MGGRRQRRFVLVILPLFALSFPSPDADAATVTVTKTADTYDGVCDADCSLREAVLDVNSGPGNEVISIPNGTFTLTDTADGDLDVIQPTTIQGSGATIIDGGTGWGERIFDIGSGIATVTFRDLTIRGGNVPAALPSGD